jgi:hypothetical protein
MTTTILVASDKQLSTRNAVADTIATLTQAEMQADSAMDDVFKELFETVPLFSLFRIDRLDRDRFMQLLNASRVACDKYWAAGPKNPPPFDNSFREVMSAWDKMLALMRLDERFSP